MFRAALTATVASFARRGHAWSFAATGGSIAIPVVEIREADPRIEVHVVASAPASRLPGVGRN